jgi:hypothetical protein
VEIEDRVSVPPRGRSAPEVVAPTNRVNVALPFSHLHVEESSRAVAELAALFADLAVIVEQAVPGPKATELRKRAETLRSRLQ